MSTTQPPPKVDPRVIRSQETVRSAALELFSTRGTTDIPMREIAEAAGVSRNVVYTHYGNRAGLVADVAFGLLDSLHLDRLRVSSRDDLEQHFRNLATHMAGHRAFYRAAMSGPDGRAFTQDFDAFFTRLDVALVRELRAAAEDEDEAADLVSFLVGGTGAVFTTWILTGSDPLEPVEFARRLTRVTWRIVAPLTQTKDH